MSPSVTVRLLATQSDARLVELAHHGHERAFEALVLRYRRPLLTYCRRVLLPEARAEDALQQALLQAWLSLQRGAEVRDACAWLYRIVHNTALNALRGSGYDYAELSEALSGTHAPQEDLDRRIAVREALAGLAALPDQQREALLRTAVEGASHADAAAEMGLTEGALRGLVYRARTTLRTAVTAVTPMPLATWAAEAAGHGGGAVAELVVGGGSAGLAGLRAKGGAAALTAGVLAAGVGAAEHHRSGHAPRPAPVARAVDADGSGSRGRLLVVVAPGGDPAATEPDAPARHGRPHGGHRVRRLGLAPTPSHGGVPELPVGSRRGGGENDGRGGPPTSGRSEGADGRGDGGGGPGPGGRHGGDHLPASGTAPVPGDGRSDGGSGGSGRGPGDGGHDGSGGGDGSRGGSGSGGGGDRGSSPGTGGDGGGTNGGNGGTGGGGTSGGPGDDGSTHSGSAGGG
jgi:RNA polymerase sigma factor (sigma-70 family)